MKMIIEKIKQLVTNVTAKAQEFVKTATYSPKNFLVKVFTIAFVFGVSMFLKLSYYDYLPMNWFGIINGMYGLGVIGLFVIFQPHPADSLNRYANEPAYDLISLLWVYPIAMCVAAITIGLFGVAQPFIVTIITMGIKFVVNGRIKNALVKKNEEYIRTNA